MTKYKCKLCNEIVVYRSLHFEVCHDSEINKAFEKAPADAKVTAGNPDGHEIK